MQRARNFLLVAVFAAFLWLGATSVGRAQGNSLGWIAYVQNGDIWTMELPSGTPKQLTSDGKNSRPRISISGEWIAFQKQDTAWVMNSSGEDAQEITGCKLEWAGITDALPCFRENGKVGVRHAPKFVIETFPRPEGLSSDTYFYGVGWIKQKPEFVYASSTRTGYSNAGDYQGESVLWRANIVEQTQTRLFELEPLKDGSILADDSMLFATAPSSQQFLYWVFPLFGSGSFSADGLPLYQMSPNTGVTPEKISEGMLQKDDWIAVAPDGQHVAFISGTYRATWTNKHLEVFDLITGARKALTDNNVSASSPAWSPDGKQIAYVAMPDMGDRAREAARGSLKLRRIWLANAEGSHAHEITNDAKYRDEYPQWSRDGQQILFARYFQAETDDWSKDAASLWLMQSDGSDLRSVVDLKPLDLDGGIQEFSWFGEYGHIAWYDYFDWWQPTDEITNVLPSTGAAETNNLTAIVFGFVLLIIGSLVLWRTRLQVA